MKFLKATFTLNYQKKYFSIRSNSLMRICKEYINQGDKNVETLERLAVIDVT